MVKADPTRDYYRDLELPPSADAQEIKKQYKKLALKYHPDRNPGHESEFNAKFQAIQSAHDVLLDPQQRARYDAERIRPNPFHTFTPPPRPKPPPRSPQANAPPPPPRQPPPFAKTQFPPPPPPPGSTRRRYVPRTDPRSSWAPPTAEDARAKSSDFKAWEQMRHGQGPIPSARSAPRYSAKSAAFSPGRDNADSMYTDSMPTRPSRDHTDVPFSHVPGVSRSQTTRTPKKAGFAPGTPGGDEPPARNSSAYFNPFRATASRDNAHVPASPRYTPSSTRPDPSQSFKNHAGVNESFANAERMSTPYATSGGEKTYFSSRPLQRSSSWKESRNHPGAHESESGTTHSPHLRPSSVAPERNQSSSPRMKNRNARRPPSPLTSSSSSSDESVELTTGEESYASTGRSNEGQKFKGRGATEGHRKPSVQPSPAMDDAEDADSARSRRSNESYQSRTGFGHPPQNHRQPKETGGDHPEGFTQHRTNHDAKKDPRFFSPNRSSEAYTPTPPTMPPRPLNKPRSWQGGQKPAQSSRPDEKATQPQVDRQDGKHRIFTFLQENPSKETKYTPSLKSHSSETINVKFSPDWPTSFTGSTNEYFFSSSADRTGDGSRKISPSRIQPIPRKRPTYQHPRPSDTPESPDNGTETNSPPPMPPKDAGLPAAATEEWAKHFRPAAWAYPPPPRSPAAKSMRKRQPCSRRVAKPYSSQFATPKPPKVFATVDDDDGDEPDVSSAGETASSKLSGDESPMDIDPALTPPTTTPSQVNEESSSSPCRGPAETTPRPAAPTAPPPPRPESSHVEGLHLNLGSLNKVTPLAPTDEGLQTLEELKTTLPFESRASNQPVDESPPPPLVLPNPPKAPFVPEKLTQAAWERYVAHMRVYMFEWNAFNTKMLNHFNERQASVEKVLKPEWMSAVGEGTDQWGYKKYMQGLDEDCRVRAHWDVSWEKHRECMKGLGGVREKLLSSAIRV